MQLNELFQPTPKSFRSEKDDHSVMDIKDTRTTRLSLSRLNKLRIMNDARKLEHEQKLEKVASQYKPPAQPAGVM